ncbi:cupin [Streptomyces sp. Ru62]|uniref:JmjC domain-containing protein n=1 Tax=Streptomyces sp. Ru62 TaxID=2080745 RepID=UPI000CDCFEAA|nr:cupin domain-containing protein [Streptomyces sp. Ru62]POX64484.1 cupin [Streptomyces sp. Ru62]
MKPAILGRWVGDTGEFFASRWHREPGVFTPAGGAYTSFGLADAEDALNTGLFRVPYIEMWEDNALLPARKFTAARTVARENPAGFADHEKIRALLDRGATMLLRCLDQWHRPTQEMLAGLAEELGRPVEAFFFVTPAGQPGLPLHRDDADVLVIQVAGAKRWRIHEGPADGNWRAGRIKDDEPQPAELLETVIRPGQVLYIPRGFAHRAVGQEGLSAHLSLTIREAGTADLTDALARHAVAGAGLDALPVTADALTGTAKKLLENAVRRLSELTPQELVDSARRHRMAHMPAATAPLSLTETAGR